MAIVAKVIAKCLNPCSNGIWSLTHDINYASRIFYGLNPCSNGIWSLTSAGASCRCRFLGLNPCSNGIWSLTGLQVHE